MLANGIGLRGWKSGRVWNSEIKVPQHVAYILQIAENDSGGTRLIIYIADAFEDAERVLALAEMLTRTGLGFGGLH